MGSVKPSGQRRGQTAGQGDCLGGIRSVAAVVNRPHRVLGIAAVERADRPSAHATPTNRGMRHHGVPMKKVALMSVAGSNPALKSLMAW
jgi:hypothetical protein